MSLNLMNFEVLLFGVSKRLTIAGGACELLPIGYYLLNLSVRLMLAMQIFVLDITQSTEKSKFLLLQLGISGTH